MKGTPFLAAAQAWRASLPPVPDVASRHRRSLAVVAIIVLAVAGVLWGVHRRSRLRLHAWPPPRAAYSHSAPVSSRTACPVTEATHPA